MILILVLLFEVVLLTIRVQHHLQGVQEWRILMFIFLNHSRQWVCFKESSTAVAATTAPTSWARSKPTSSCRAARRSDWSISERNEDGWEMISSWASARMEILDFERKRTVRFQGLVGEVQWLVESYPWCLWTRTLGKYPCRLSHPTL